MKIRAIHIEGFGKLQQVDLPLDGGLQILCGENERGKSTLLQFIRAMLYGVAKKNSDPRKSRERYNPWQTTSWGGYLVLEDAEGHRFRLERRFGETQAKDRLRFLNEATGDELAPFWGAKQQPGEALYQMSESIFLSTALLSQDLPDSVEGLGSTELAAHLRALVGGSDPELSGEEVRKRIESAMTAIRPKKKVPGRAKGLPALEEELRQVRHELREADEATEESRRFLEQEEAIRREEEELEAEIQVARDRLDRLADWERDYTRLQQDRERFLRYRDLQKAQHERLQALRHLQLSQEQARELVEVLPQALENLQEQEAEKKQLALQLQEGEAQAQDLAQKLAEGQWLPDPNGLYPWDLVQSRVNRAQRLRQHLQQWENWQDVMLLNRQIAVEAEEAKTHWEKEKDRARQAERQVQDRETLLRQKQRQAEEKERQYQEAAVEQKLRQEEREAQLQLRLKAYYRHLRKLLYTAHGFTLAFVLSLAATFLWLPAGQSQLLAGLGCLVLATCAAGFYVKRSVYPPELPQAVTDPDAERRLEAKRLEAEGFRYDAQRFADLLVEERKHYAELQRQEISAEEAYRQLLRRQEATRRDGQRLLRDRMRAAHLPEESPLWEEDEALRRLTLLQDEKRAGDEALVALLAKYQIQDVKDLPGWQAEGLHLYHRQEQVARQLEEGRQRMTRLEKSLQELAQQLRQLIPGETLPEDLGAYHTQLVRQVEALDRYDELLRKEEEAGLVHPKEEQLTERGYRLLQRLEQEEAPETLRTERFDLEAFRHWMESLDGAQSRRLEALQELKERRAAVFHHRNDALRRASVRQDLVRRQGEVLAEMARQEAYYRRLQQVQQWYTAAADRLQNTLAPVLNQKAGEYLSLLTDEKYQNVYVSRSIDLKVDVPGERSMVPNVVLSAGTLDQSYLALRLALLDYLDPGAKLPLLCDDPLVNYDPARELAALRLLAALARKGRQILFVSCHPLPNGFRPGEEEASYKIW